MTEDVKGGCSLLKTHRQIAVESSEQSNVCIPVSQPAATVYINPTMTIDNSCVYTAAIPADLAGSFSAGTVLQIMPNSAILTVAPMKKVPTTDTSNATIIFKDSSISAEAVNAQNSLSVPNLLVESVENAQSQIAEVPVGSEGNISDIDLSFLNETEESVIIPDSKSLSENAVKEFQGLIPGVSSHPLDILQSNLNNVSAASKDQFTAESENTSSDVVMIDVSKPIQLSQNSLIMVNGQKCVLQHDAQTGQVVAYPVREQEKPRRRRGRPRKASIEKITKEIPPPPEPADSIEFEIASEEEKEKGLLEVVNDDGALVRRSSRKRKLAKVLKDYETGNLKQELGSDVEDTDVIECDSEANSRKRKGKATARPKKYVAPQSMTSSGSFNNGTKRQRGRPRKAIVENEPTQAFLVQTADGQTLMMQVPLSSIPAGVTLQEMAQTIANRLNLSLNQVNNDSVTEVKDDESSKENEAFSLEKSLRKNNSETSLGNAEEPAVQDHSIGSTTNFPMTEQLENMETHSEADVDNSCEDIISNMDHIIVDSVSESEVSEVILGNGDCVKDMNVKGDSVLPDVILSTHSQYNEIDVPECSQENFCINIPSTNSSSVDNSSMICNLSDSLNERYCVTKSDQVVLGDNFNNVQGLENSRIPKDFFINSDFMKDKNIQLLLQNVTATAESSITGCTSTSTTITDGKHCKPSELPEDLLSSNVSLKDFNVRYEAVVDRKSDSEKNYIIQQVPDQENLKGNNDKSDAFGCNLNNSNDNTSNKIPLKTHLVINSSDSNDFTQSKQFLHDSNNCKLTNVNENSNSGLIHSGILANNASTFQAILPIEKISPILEPATSKEGLTLTTVTSAVIPVSTVAQLQRPEKILPILLPAQEIAGSKKCKVCETPYSTDEEIIQHFKVKHPRCICKECNYMAEHPYVIKRHSYRHNNNGCVCKICGKQYKDHYILKMHIKMVHLPAEVLYSCNICNKQFTRKAHLKRHLRIHEPDKPYKCLYCDYRGCEKSDITKHLLIHDAPKHKCHLCDKSFRHIKNKELHLKRHLKQKDYKCGVCDFYGYTFTDIRKHIERRHTDQKLSTCAECGQAYKNIEQLKEHKKNGQCHTYLLAQELTKGDESISTEINKETALLEEMPLEIIPDSEQSKISSSTISECSEETLNVLQSGQFVLGSVEGICNAQQGQIVLNGLEENNLASSGNLSYISVEKDSNKLITLVTTDGRSISLPLKNCSVPLECVSTSEKTNSIEALAMPGMKVKDSSS